MPREWIIAPRNHDDLVTQLLVNRGIPPEEREYFLSPDWEKGTYSPFLFAQMQQAVDAMFFAMEHGDAIVIHGDYDADGVSGVALLFGALKDIAEQMKYVLNVEVFLPDRERDGYGVAMHTVDRFIAEEKKLLVTIDCGIAYGLELDHAHDAGIVTIVCDHHQLGEHFPNHAIVLHPSSPGETYPNRSLCGTGVAFKFASALICEARKRGADFVNGYEKWMLDLVAIATVTDVMPLTGENRVLEHFGLKVLNKTRRPGIRAILAASGTELGGVDTQAIGFRIGPRLNAAGRLSRARLAFDAIAATSIGEAEAAATILERLNRERQNIFRASYKQAEGIARNMLSANQVLVVTSDDWLPGIVGLIAGKLVGDFGCPAFVLTRVDGRYVGSGRTAGGLHLVEAMDACGDVFLKKGGHPQACGLTIQTLDQVDLFRKRVNEFAKGIFGDVGVVQTLMIDAVVAPSAMTLDLLESLEACAPFGEGNRSPVFAVRGETVMTVETMGTTASHLRLTVLDEEGVARKFVGFGLGNRAKEFSVGTRVDIAYEPGINVWNGRREVQCKIVDIQKHI
ncbi:MAG: single-stranded-DNA-specific exonuclease RecJ [Patescibacteria group bacterium]